MGSAARIAFRGVDRLVTIGVVGAAAGFAIGLLGRQHWQAELLSHFRVQYVLALLFASVYFLLRRRWRLLLATLAVLACAGWPLADYFLPYGNAASAPDKHRLRVLSLNVDVGNGRADLVATAIAQADPDVIFLPEAAGSWVAALAPLRVQYRYGAGEGAQGAFSLLLLSRLPLRDAKVVPLSEWPAVTARLCPSETAGAADCIAFIGIHPPPPVAPNLAARRNDVFRALPAAIARLSPGTVVLAGDFNCTPWSPLFADLLAAAGLRDGAIGFGVWPTWNSTLLPLGLSIDHVLVGERHQRTQLPSRR